MMFKNKRASYVDIFFIIVFLFGFALILLVTKLIFNKINNADFRAISTDAPRLMDVGDKITSMYDSIFFMLFIGMIIAVIVSAFFINTHPVFFFTSLLALFVALVLSPMISNVYNEITHNASDTDLSGVADNFTRMKFVFDNFPTIILVTFVLVLITTFVVLVKFSS